MPAACAARQAWISPSPMLHAGQPDRREDQRHRRRLAENAGRQIALRDVDQDALAELDLLQVVDVGAQRLLGIGAAIGVVEERLRHLAHVNLAQILDAGDVLHERSSPSGTLLVFRRFDVVVIYHAWAIRQIAPAGTLSAARRSP